ncbi:MAG: hypothetical protein IKN72_07425 [Clostridia bacterium]|nr:hypothetical protein [Clostridia bacterium]
MRRLFERFILAATILTLLTLGSTGAARVFDRAQTVLYGKPAAVLAMQQTDGRLVLTDERGPFPLPDLSRYRRWTPLLYATPLGSVLGVIEAVAKRERTDVDSIRNSELWSR